MTELPESVKAEIEKEAEYLLASDAAKGLRHCYRIGAEFGYRLASKRAEGLVKSLVESNVFMEGFNKKHPSVDADWLTAILTRQREALKAYRGEK